MKIIAKGGGRSNPVFIVEAKESELCRIMGYAYTTSMPEGERRRIAIGFEIDVHKIYDHLASLAALPDGVEDVREKLAEILDVLGDVGKVADLISIEMPEK